MTPEQLVTAWESQSSISTELRARIVANDMEALSACLRNEDYVRVDDVPVDLSRPFLLLAGDRDEIYPALAGYAARLSAGSVVRLRRLTHLQSFQRSDLVLPIVTGFLDRVSRAVP
jgi:hypothetical protein